MRRSQRKQQTEDLKVEVQRSIRQMRQELGLSQKQLADKMNSNVVQATVSNWESGKTELTLSQLIDIMLICGKDLGSYFGFYHLQRKQSLNQKIRNDDGYFYLYFISGNYYSTNVILEFRHKSLVHDNGIKCRATEPRNALFIYAVEDSLLRLVCIYECYLFSSGNLQKTVRTYLTQPHRNELLQKSMGRT